MKLRLLILTGLVFAAPAFAEEEAVMDSPISSDTPASSDTVVPAKEEDVDAFDKSLAEGKKALPEKASDKARANVGKAEGDEDGDGVKKPKKAKPVNFGQTVKAEIQRQREAGTKGSMGEWVSKQRRNDADAKGAAPAPASSGERGKSEAHKKQ